MALGVTIEMAWLTTFLLLSIRLTAVLLLTPPLYHTSIPTPIRVLLVLALALVMTGASNVSLQAPALTMTQLVLSAIRECIVGLALGLGIHVAFSAFSLGGQLLDVQIGFGMGQVFDPITSTQVPIITTILNLMALLLFYTGDFHHVMFRGLFASIEHVPVAATDVAGVFFIPQVSQMTSMFSLGFALVAPVVICLLMVEVAVGVIARSLQKINLFIFSIPLRIVVGLGALMLWMQGAAPTTRRIYDSIFYVWNEAFK